ncbi:MAG: hypothetical protein RL217_1549 [Pseudomonadota bacterium]|jgi:hypothetical protein
MLHAYKVRHILVFANKGTEAKLLAAPQIEPNEYWRENVDKWVALRAERDDSLDHLWDSARTEPYIHSAN